MNMTNDSTNSKRIPVKSLTRRQKSDVVKDYLVTGGTFSELAKRHDVNPHHISYIIDEYLKTLRRKNSYK